jgi:biopolymer transport protein ExbD
VPTVDDCYPWQPDGCEWTVRFLWRWMSSFGRLDVIVLALMLVYLFAVVVHVYCRYYLARRARRIDSAGRRTLAAVLNIEVGHLKSIALTAPCLGLAGTCEGILSALGVMTGQRDAVSAMLVIRTAVALIPTAAAIPVAAVATASYNYLCTRIGLLGAEVFEEKQGIGRHSRGARRFSPTERFAEAPAFGLLTALPAFGLLVALGLTVAVKAYMPLASMHKQTGFYVELASARCEHNIVDKQIVLHITDAGKVFLNQEQEDWSSLEGRLSEIYSTRESRTILLVADSSVPFQTVAAALDIVDQLDIKVQLVTPKALEADCPPGSGHPVLR